MYYSTKTYGTDRGLSCAFRQWRATHSHCRFLHGYSIGVKFIFESTNLDERNWCFDFGGMKPIKDFLDHTFDHKTLIAEDDPELAHFTALNKAGLIQLEVVEGVGCEKFAEMIYHKTQWFLDEFKSGAGRYTVTNNVRLKSVEVFEHGANSAIFEE